MTSIEQRFNAAVNVIRGLPKNGSYQPSNDMMLRFYSYFKQATLGPCTHKKPAFWDVVNRAKWDAWKSLGDMPKEKAMTNYVDELKKIIETMSYTDNVAQFMGSISELDGVNVDDLEAVAPDTIKKARSHPNSPFASRESSPIRAPMVHPKTNGVAVVTNGNGSVYVNGNHEPEVYQNGHLTEQSDDEYIDTVEDDPETSSFRSTVTTSSHHSRSKARKGYPTVNSISTANVGDSSSLIEVLSQLNCTVDRMNIDIQQVTNRINILERSLLEVRYLQASKIKQYPSWWPFEEISPNWFLFMILWPFLAQKLVQMIQKKK